MSKLQPGKEYPIPNEDFYIDKITHLFKKTLGKYYPSGLTKRIFHPKMHGLVEAQFIISKDLDPALCVGLFQPGASYAAWVRLSNAKKHPAHDKKKDMRGMAIKLLGVRGEKLIKEESDALTHDFVLVTSKTLQTKSVKDFWKSLSALMGNPLKLFWYAITHLGVLIRSIRQISKCGSVLEASFFSTTPYRFGGETTAVKYAVVPGNNFGNAKVPKKAGYNFLRERLIEDLSREDFYFDFCIQFQEDPDKMPIEDPTVVWTSPYVKLATLKIPKQQFDFPAQIKYGESLSFTPWHCIEEHRPIGGVNRARKRVYEELSKFRHERNGEVKTEPQYTQFPVIDMGEEKV